MAPTAHYVAVDRPHLQYKEMQFMRLASYINAVPELRWDFRCQEMPDEVHVEVDNDGAQCPRTRRRLGVLGQTITGQ